jgi:hypothetical protein
MATIYPDRFDLKYLRFLAEQLELNTLKKNFIKEKRSDGSERKKKCIQINFCGVASNTLLGTNVRGSVLSPEISQAQKVVEKNFKTLFDESTLNDLYKNNFYLKVRFCFAYVYSDFPVCLIKAEDPENWRFIKDGGKYDYHYTKPININVLKKRSIYRSQESSLGILKDILQKSYGDGHDLATWEKEKHSVHLRFTAMPSPICLLMINNTALCDSYLYGMLQERKNSSNKITDNESKYETTVSLHYPTTIIKKAEDMVQFSSLENHYKYLWRHDLTLFCGDGTGFKIIGEKNGRNLYDFEGLTDITPPDKVRWKDKINRIRKSKERNGLRQPNWLWIHFVWRRRLTNKLKLCTAKVVSNTIFGRFIHNSKRNILLWFLSTLLLFLAFYVYSFFVSKGDLSASLEWFKSHAVFEIFRTSLLFLALLIVQGLLGSRE